MSNAETIDLLTVAEAAGLCRVSTKTIRRLIKAGQLPRISFGERSRVLVRRTDLVDFLEALYGREGDPSGRRMSRVGG